MAGVREERRLAAILALDMVGFSRLMEANEDDTIVRHRAHRQDVFDPKIGEYNGRIVKTTGDGLLVEFASAVDAVLCAVEMQRAINATESETPEDRRIAYRIGINLGEIVIDGDDILGDGVNVAARLEGLAEPAGIVISEVVFRNVRGKLDLGFADLGAQSIKNIAEPVETYQVLLDPEAVGTVIESKSRVTRSSRLRMAALAVSVVATVILIVMWAPWTSTPERASAARMKLNLPKNPSIAVLPFTNLSGDKAQAYFADGVTEDIITGLSKISGIFTVAGTSTFKFRDKKVTARTVAEEFGVRHVLFGSIVRSENRVRISVRLIDAIKGRQLWAERFDRKAKDIFAIQAEVTRQVVKALAVTLKANEAERLYRKHTTNIEAYELFLRARKLVLVPGRNNVQVAEELFKRVIKLDPKFAGGYAGLALNYSMKVRFQFSGSPAEDRKKSLALAKKAKEIDPDFVWSYIALGAAHLARRDPEAAVDAVAQALVIQPNGYEANLWMGFYLHFAGQHRAAVEHLVKANRISPVNTSRKYAFMAMAYFMNGDYAKSVHFWQKRFGAAPVRAPLAYVFLCAALELSDATAKAKACAAKFQGLNTKFRLSKMGYIKLYKSPADRKRLYDAAVKAGIPE